MLMENILNLAHTKCLTAITFSSVIAIEGRHEFHYEEKHSHIEIPLVNALQCSNVEQSSQKHFEDKQCSLA